MTPEEVRVVVQQVLDAQAVAHPEITRLRAALEAAEREIQHLRDHLTSKDALIALQAETLSLLRGGYTRPN